MLSGLTLLAAPTAMAQVSANSGHITATSGTVSDNSGANGGVSINSAVGPITVDGASITNSTGTPSSYALSVQGTSALSMSFSGVSSSLAGVGSNRGALFFQSTSSTVNLSLDTAGSFSSGSSGFALYLNGLTGTTLNTSAASTFTGSSSTYGIYGSTGLGNVSLNSGASGFSGFTNSLYASAPSSYSASVTTTGGTIVGSGSGAVGITASGGAGATVTSGSAMTAVNVGIQASSNSGGPISVTTTAGGTIDGLSPAAYGISVPGRPGRARPP